MIPSHSEGGCLSDFALDRRLANELDASEEMAARAHLASCARCETRLAARMRERDDFAANAPPLRLVAPKKRAWIGVASVVLAAAASVVLFVATRGSTDTRTKGDAAQLDFYVNHQGMVRHGVSTEQVRPGDGLRFVVTARDARYLAVLSVDGAKHASVYYPHGPDAERVDVGTNVALPESTTLDDTLGDETIYGVFCPSAFTTEPLRRALEAAPDQPLHKDGCTIEALHLRKEALGPR